MRAGFGQGNFACFFAALARRYLYDFKKVIFEIRVIQGLKWYIICLCPFKFNPLVSIIWGEKPYKSRPVLVLKTENGEN